VFAWGDGHANHVEEGGDLLIALGNIASAKLGPGDVVAFLKGTGPVDVNAQNGVDTLFAKDGNDFLSGGNGDDFMRGGGGDDTLLGLADDDTLTGDLGKDSLLGGSGTDFLSGGFGNDTLDGGNHSDILSGDAGDDSLNGRFGKDIVLGRDGNDDVRGGAGDDIAIGGTGNDTVDAGPGDDFIMGNFEFDLRTVTATEGSAEGADTIFGGDGDDKLVLGAFDTGTGGDGGDVFSLILDTKNIPTVTDFTPGEDKLVVYFDPTAFSGLDASARGAATDSAGTSVVSLFGDGPDTPAEGIPIVRLVGIDGDTVGSIDLEIVPISELNAAMAVAMAPLTGP